MLFLYLCVVDSSHVHGKQCLSIFDCRQQTVWVQHTAVGQLAASTLAGWCLGQFCPPFRDWKYSQLVKVIRQGWLLVRPGWGVFGSEANFASPRLLLTGQLSPKKPPWSEKKVWPTRAGKSSLANGLLDPITYIIYICSVLNYICGKNVSAKHLGWVRIFPGRRWWTLDNPESEGFQLILLANVTNDVSVKINSQRLEDTQVGYISQKYTLDKYTLEK